MRCPPTDEKSEGLCGFECDRHLRFGCDCNTDSRKAMCKDYCTRGDGACDCYDLFATDAMSSDCAAICKKKCICPQDRNFRFGADLASQSGDPFCKSHCDAMEATWSSQCDTACSRLGGFTPKLVRVKQERDAKADTTLKGEVFNTGKSCVLHYISPTVLRSTRLHNYFVQGLLPGVFAS